MENNQTIERINDLEKQKNIMLRFKDEKKNIDQE